MKILSKIKNKVAVSKLSQQIVLVLAIFMVCVAVFSIWPWATDGYETITDRGVLEQRIAQAITNHQSEVMIDYSGSDFANLKNWLKDCFKYPILSKYTDEFSIYNYDGAKFVYWTYGDKKRVKITISYKLTSDEVAMINSYADNVISNNSLNGKSTYEQIKFIHDWLINTFSYNLGSNNLYNMIQDNKANCYGYTMMNYLILNKLGIPVRTTCGKLRGSHIWNVVQVDGTWYYEDVTWDTARGNNSYFLVSSEKLRKTHTIEGNFIVECPSNYTPPVSANIVTDDTNIGVIPDDDKVNKLNSLVQTLQELKTA